MALRRNFYQDLTIIINHEKNKIIEIQKIISVLFKNSINYIII